MWLVNCGRFYLPNQKNVFFYMHFWQVNFFTITTESECGHTLRRPRGRNSACGRFFILCIQFYNNYVLTISILFKLYYVFSISKFLKNLFKAIRNMLIDINCHTIGIFVTIMIFWPHYKSEIVKHSAYINTAYKNSGINILFL